MILADLHRLRNRPPPTDASSAGGALAIVAIVTMVLMPFVGRGFGLSGATMLALGIGLAVAGLVGALLAIFGGGFVRGAVVADVERAIEELVATFPDGDEDKLRGAAIRILDQSVVSQGPTSVHAFDRQEVADRLGPALEYVLRIERFLLEQNQIYASFTLLPESPPRYPDNELPRGR